MALSANKTPFGIHSICAYNPETFQPYGISKVVGALTLNFTGEQVPLNGGSLLYPWAVEKGLITTEGTLTIREVPTWSFQAFQGATATDVAAESGGGVGAILNAKGTSAKSATTGIASATVKSGKETDLKSTLYMGYVVSATTVDIFSFTDVDFLRGTALTYQNDLLKVTAAPLTITASTAVEIPNTGIELTGGSGTIAMTVGDTFWFDSRSINTGSRVTTVGKSGETIPDIGIFCAAQKQGDGEIFFLDIMNCAASGFPFNFTEKTWMEGEVSFQAYYNAARNGVYREIYVNGA